MVIFNEFEDDAEEVLENARVEGLGTLVRLSLRDLHELGLFFREEIYFADLLDELLHETPFKDYSR